MGDGQSKAEQTVYSNGEGIMTVFGNDANHLRLKELLALSGGNLVGRNAKFAGS
jgi:hypothetical protein